MHYNLFIIFTCSVFKNNLFNTVSLFNNKSSIRTKSTFWSDFGIQPTNWDMPIVSICLTHYQHFVLIIQTLSQRQFSTGKKKEMLSFHMDSTPEENCGMNQLKCWENNIKSKMNEFSCLKISWKNDSY